MRDFFRGTQKVHVQSRLAGSIEEYRDQEDLTVIEGDAQLPAIRANEDILDGPVSELSDCVCNAPEILDGSQRHEAVLAPVTRRAAG